MGAPSPPWHPLAELVVPFQVRAWPVSVLWPVAFIWNEAARWAVGYPCLDCALRGPLAESRWQPSHPSLAVVTNADIGCRPPRTPSHVGVVGSETSAGHVVDQVAVLHRSAVVLGIAALHVHGHDTERH